MQVCEFYRLLNVVLTSGKISLTFARDDQVLISQALHQDETDIYERLWDISATKSDQVLLLDGGDAENFMCLMQTVRI
jgi:hypothetical protein